jgi:hypothetical protein
MESRKLSNSIQVITAVFVLIGLGLVVWELQQVKTLTRAQLTSESVATHISIFTSMLGEEAASVLAKACLNPEELTLQEAVILDNYYLANANLLARLILQTDRDGVYPEGSWRDSLFYLNPILASRYGREWILSLGSGWPSGFMEATKTRIDQLGPPSCESSFGERIEQIRSQPASSDSGRDA